MAKGKRPEKFLSFSAQIRKGKYAQGPSVGLWDNDGKGPMARGTVKEDYLSDLIKFLKKHEDDGVSISLFKGKKGGGKRRDEDDDDDDEEEEEDEDEDEDEDDDDKPKKKGKGKKGKKGKKGGWDFDEDDDD